MANNEHVAQRLLKCGTSPVTDPTEMHRIEIGKPTRSPKLGQWPRPGGHHPLPPRHCPAAGQRHRPARAQRPRWVVGPAMRPRWVAGPAMRRNPRAC
eukprot:9931909-Alexandrium_andersonii.AAC.1